MKTGGHRTGHGPERGFPFEDVPHSAWNMIGLILPSVWKRVVAE